MFEKIVVVTRKTRLEELVARFNSRGQAKFYIEHAGGDFSDYEREEEAYRRAVDLLRRQLDLGLKLQFVDRGFVPNFLFSEKDLVVTVGQDGLVANTAKYVGAQPIVAVNPDPERFDGVLLPFRPPEAAGAVRRVLAGKAGLRTVTMAEANLNDGQRLRAFNDLFIGASSHVSARYRITLNGTTEPHSSSGVLVATGAGSTGWLSSVFNMAWGVAEFSGGQSAQSERQGVRQGIPMTREDPELIFVVREPFVSKHSRAGLVAGRLRPGQELLLESLMPSGGVIFSDGIEADFLAFNSGAIAHIRASDQRAGLVVS